MYCPRCGQKQMAGDLKFCSRCGLPMGLVAELLANGGESSATVGTCQK